MEKKKPKPIDWGILFETTNARFYTSFDDKS